MDIQIEHGYITRGNIFRYSFKGGVYLFELHKYLGASPLKRNGEISLRPPKNFWSMIKKFESLPNIEKEKFRAY